MKKLLGLVGATSLVLALTNCGNENVQDNSSLHPATTMTVYVVSLDLPQHKWTDLPCESSGQPGRTMLFPYTDFSQYEVFELRADANAKAKSLKAILSKTCSDKVGFFCKKGDANFRAIQQRCKSAINSGITVSSKRTVVFK